MKTVKNSHHIRILSDSEIDDLYARPQLKKDEMTFLFDLSANETAILNTGLSMERKIDAIIQLGFFRKKKRFFDFTLSDVSGEAHYVSELYFGETKIQRADVGRNARNLNRQWVLEMTGYVAYRKSEHFQMIFDRALELCRISSDPVTLFRELIGFLDRHKISLPGYTTASSALPAPDEQVPLIEKEKGAGPVESTRVIRNIVQECFNAAVEELRKKKQQEEAETLRSATVHWLRHTGISDDVKFRPRKHVRDDAGHSSSAITDRYIDVELQERARTAKKEKKKCEN